MIPMDELTLPMDLMGSGTEVGHGRELWEGCMREWEGEEIGIDFLNEIICNLKFF